MEITQPAWLRDSGFYLRGTREYQEGGIWYNYRLYTDGNQMICSRTGSRGMLSYLFPASAHPEGKRKRLFLHRLWAFNSPRINSGPHPYSYSGNIVVHHAPHPRWRPWSNSRTANMELMTVARHKEWHRNNPDVPRR